MRKMVCLIGVGEIGGVLARGILRAGYPVYPIGKDISLGDAAKEIPDPHAVVVAVGEKDLQPVLQSMPAGWKDKVILLQNELLPRDWESSVLVDPTIISIWFEKKPGQDYKVILPSPVWGPRAEFLKTSLESIEIPSKILSSKEDLVFELALKNLYILTTNISGIEAGGTVGELWADHQGLARQVTDEVMDIQFSLIKTSLDREKLLRAMVQAFEADPSHKCMGRSAPVRLARAVLLADQAGLAVPKLRAIAGLGR